MMNLEVASEEYSSGCESGWTLYLEQSNSNPNTFSNNVTCTNKKNSSKKNKQKKSNLEEDYYNKNNSYLIIEQDEDLSMVSDASSGPPHFDNYQDLLSYNNNNINNEGLLRKQCCNNNNIIDDFGLDDTASSHVFAPKKIVGSNIHVQNNQGASFERFIDYSSHGYSTTHFQVGLNSKKSGR